MAPKDSGVLTASHCEPGTAKPPHFLLSKAALRLKSSFPPSSQPSAARERFFPMPAPPPRFPGQLLSMARAALQDAGAHPGDPQRAGKGEKQLGQGPLIPSHPLPSPGRCRRLPSLLRKRVTPRAPGQGHEGLHMEVICSWERICQRGCGTGPGVKIARTGPSHACRSGCRWGAPRATSCFFWGGLRPPSEQGFFCRCFKNAPGAASEGSSLTALPRGGQPRRERQSRARIFLQAEGTS